MNEKEISAASVSGVFPVTRVVLLGVAVCLLAVLLSVPASVGTSVDVTPAETIISATQ